MLSSHYQQIFVEGVLCVVTSLGIRNAKINVSPTLRGLCWKQGDSAKLYKLGDQRREKVLGIPGNPLEQWKPGILRKFS
jgi:hypothetical protein